MDDLQLSLTSDRIQFEHEARNIDGNRLGWERVSVPQPPVCLSDDRIQFEHEARNIDGNRLGWERSRTTK